jgi:large subunit ribosomal protein L19
MAKIPDIKPGDLVKVYFKITEGEKERTTTFEGIIMQIRGMAKSKTFTVRKISAGVGVERIFPLRSPMIKIEIKKKGMVRRAKLSYLRRSKGGKMKIKEVAVKTSAKAKPAELVADKDEKPVVEKPATEKEKPIESSGKKEVKKTKEPKRETAPGQKSVEKT